LEVRTYRANLFVVALAFAIPGGFFIAVSQDIFFKKSSPGHGSLLILAGFFIAWMLVLAYLLALRVELGTDSIAYRNLLHGRVVIPLDEISSTIHEKREGSESTTYVLIVTPRIKSGKPIIKIPLYLLSFSAGTELAPALSAKERDSKDLLTLG